MVEKKKSHLTAIAINALNKPGSYADGKATGLYLRVAPAGTKSWTIRVMLNGKRVERGLGGYPAMSISRARQCAEEERAKLKAGIDPKAEREAARLAYDIAQARAKTFRECGEAYIDANEINWRNAKHIQQWRNTLALYAYPVIGDLQVDKVNYSHVLAILDPIWQVKNETARRMRGRLESVLDWAEARGYRTETANPAALSAKLRAALPTIKKRPGVAGRRGNQRALPWVEAPDFIKKLRAMPGIAAQALEFTIITAARSGEVRGATWGEVDLDAALWTVPSTRMKGGKEHRVPLPKQAISLLQSLKPENLVMTNLLFPSSRKKTMLSDMALTAVLRRMSIDAVPHGFRSTFRDWAAEATTYPRDVAEMALAHAIADQTEAAYRRGDMFNRRRAMMDDWADYLDLVTVKAHAVSE